MKLNARQRKCISALIALQGELAQLKADSASWYAHSPMLANPVRLSLTGGDVWQLTKLGHLVKHPTERKFTVPAVQIEAPVCSNIEAIRRLDNIARGFSVAA